MVCDYCGRRFLRPEVATESEATNHNFAAAPLPQAVDFDQEIRAAQCLSQAFGLVTANGERGSRAW